MRNCNICGGTFKRQPVHFEDKEGNRRTSHLLVCERCGDTIGSPEQHTAGKAKVRHA